MRIHLQYLERRIARGNCADDEAQQRSGTVYSRRVGLARGGDYHLAALRIDSLDDGNFLRSAGEKSSVANFFHLNHRRVVVDEERD